MKATWDFNVRKFDKQEYIVVFPNHASLDTLTKLSCFEMSLYGLKGKLEKSSLDLTASSMLHTVWIKIHNVPRIVREVKIAKELVTLVVEPLVVDELSLIRNDPLRVQGRYRNPAAIRGYIDFFFNGVGCNLKFEAAGHQGFGKGVKGGPLGPGPRKPDDSQNRDKDDNKKGGQI